MKLLELDQGPDQFFENLNNDDKPKKYVRVIGDFRLSYDDTKNKLRGVIKPLILVYPDGRQYSIDQVSEPIKCASLKCGGIGLRYTCRIKNTFLYLYLEDDIWYYERA